MNRVARRAVFCAIAVASASVTLACGWNPKRPFDRDAPQVTQAIEAYEAGAHDAAAALLEDYLTTGPCSDGNIGTPSRLRERPNGTFDLGLALFRIAETFGRPFGEEEGEPGLPQAGHAPSSDQASHPQRASGVECALRIVRMVADDTTAPASVRGRARYVEGNLLFLNAAYKESVTAYDRALALIPGMNDAGVDGGRGFDIDALGRDAAWNRAIALRRIEDKKDAGNDASSDGGNPNNDGGPGDGGGGGNEPQPQSDGGNQPPSPDAGPSTSPDASPPSPQPDEDAGAPPPQPKEPPPPSRQSQDDRILDQLEHAPTVQQHSAKERSRRRNVRGAADK